MDERNLKKIQNERTESTSENHDRKRGQRRNSCKRYVQKEGAIKDDWKMIRGQGERRGLIVE
jgi:hypothetical protein